MPPVVAQDPFVAVHQALQARWLDVPMAVLSVLFEAWALALVALAVLSWLEKDVPSVLRAYLPLAVALGVGAAAVFLLREAWGAPRPVGAQAGIRVVLEPVLRHGFPTGQALHAATFAAYTLRRYGRRGLFALAFPVLAVFSRIYAGPAWPVEVGLGLVLGTALGLGARAAAVRLGAVRLDSRPKLP
jgi:hypothetical protein